MNRKVIGLLFFVLWTGCPLVAAEYRVQKGDTATEISQKEKVPLSVLQRANPGVEWSRLVVGEKIAVPEAYTVKAGDTLYSLCRRAGLDQAAVVALNGMSSSVLRVGQVLYLLSPPANPVPVNPSAFWPVDRVAHPEGDKLRSVTFSTKGEPFRSVSSGTVVYIGEFRGVGRVLLVQTPDKVVFAYGNFEAAAVEFGVEVAKGQVLGTTSSRPSQKLTFFAFQDSKALDVQMIKR